MRASQEGHARRKRKQTGVVVAPRPASIATVRLPSIIEEPPVVAAIREEVGMGGIQADSRPFPSLRPIGGATPAMKEDIMGDVGVIMADSAIPMVAMAQSATPSVPMATSGSLQLDTSDQMYLVSRSYVPLHFNVHFCL